MPNIVISSWNGGISSHYHTGAENQCSDMENIDISAHPDAIILANSVVQISETNGNITAGVNMQEYTKKESAGMVYVTDIGEIFYKNEKIHTESGRKYLQIFYDSYTENEVKKTGIFLVHTTGIDRMQYNKTADVFYGFIRDVDSFRLKAETVEKIPLVRWNNNTLLGVGNQLVAWDGVMFQNKIKLSEITKIVGLTAYGDYVHIYATDGETSYKAIYDPINDEEQPGSIRNFGRMEWIAVIENENVDMVVADNDDIYQSSGLQIQKYINATKDIYREDKDYNHIIAGYNEKIFIGSKKYLYEILPGEMGMSPKITKYNIGGEITFLYGSKSKIFVGYKKPNGGNVLANISERSGENPVETGKYETLWFRTQKYGKITGIDIQANVHGKSGGSIEIHARRDIADDWTKIAEFSEKKWIQQREKGVLADKIGNFHEIQLKIILKKSSDGKSPILYSLILEYDNTNNATI